MERKKRLLVSMAAGIAAMLISMGGVSSVRAEVEREQQEVLARYGGDLVSVCVATRELEPGDSLGEADVAVEEWVASLLPSDATRDLDEVIGKPVASRVPKGAVLCPAYFRTDGDSVSVPAGKVAVSVPVDSQHAVGGALECGERVDVYVSRDAVADRLCAASVLDTSMLAEQSSELTWATLAVDPASVKEVLVATSAGTVTIVVPGAAAPPEGAEGSTRGSEASGGIQDREGA